MAQKEALVLVTDRNPVTVTIKNKLLDWVQFELE